MLKQIPKFKSEDEEREFWVTHDSTEYMDWDQAERATFSKLKPSAKTFSLFEAADLDDAFMRQASYNLLEQSEW